MRKGRLDAVAKNRPLPVEHKSAAARAAQLHERLQHAITIAIAIITPSSPPSTSPVTHFTPTKGGVLTHLDPLHALHALRLLVHVRIGPAPQVQLQPGVEDEHVAGVEAIRRARDL